MFVFSKGIEVLNSNNSYDIKYDGPDKTPWEKWLPFTKKEKLIMNSLIKNLQLGLLVIILISTIIAVFIEINNMYHSKSVTLADLLLMFLYLEVMAMVRVFWDEQSIRITLPLLIAITALSRFIIMQGKEMDPSALVYQSAAILLIAVAIVVMRLRHSKKLGIESKSKKK